MRTLSKPTVKVDEFYRLCISRVKNSNLRDRLKTCEVEVVSAAQEYEKKVKIAKLHTIERKDGVLDVSTEEMNKVYTTRMVPKKSPGRAVYDMLLNAPPQGICPLCGQRTVSTLDHHLPKALYPTLSVVPINLVPACQNCNKTKLHSIPLSGEEETIHPYFDEIEEDKWLFAKIERSKPLKIIFEAIPPIHWKTLLSSRVKFHFESFELADLYGAHAAVELKNIRYYLNELFDKAGSESLHDHLLMSAVSREMEHKNSWQAAMYRSLADSKWFYNGGVKFI
jgi:5-methylcytosine-specific restriction endonuclease McrA